ncbi:hypothetical protein [Ramlibacter sp.]|uniref:hypothetical protein n=1 Tax=Ramlibacter sp. TaxID=1917967 RepID=UPI00263708E9|nr:hypothetical protein [Ramlibacter sp.]MDB5955071.1 hypothetical protein [Ramlibacter sp.]
MADHDDSTRTPVRPQPFTLYAAGGRVYASNSDQKVIDLGELARDDSGAFAWLLDGNQQRGSGFTEEAALGDLAQRLRFLWLDGQFTALADARAGVNLEGATRLDIVLDELEPGERMYDATV